MKNEILKYRMLTLTFAILALGSLGAISQGTSLIRIALTFVAFSSVALYFFAVEEELVDKYKKERRAVAKRRRLKVYNATQRKKASVA